MANSEETLKKGGRLRTTNKFAIGKIEWMHSEVKPVYATNSMDEIISVAEGSMLIGC